MGVMRILDSSGDTKVLWEVSDDEALARAASLFDELSSEAARLRAEGFANRDSRIRSSIQTRRRSSGCAQSRADELPSLHH